MEAGYIISFENVSKNYENKDGTLQALDCVSFGIKEGDIYGVIGMSGAGKSTLVRCVNRLDTVSGGHIYYKNKDITALSGKELRDLRREVSMIFQQFHLFEQRTVLKNVMYPLEIAGVKKEEAQAKARQLLSLVGILDKADAYPATLSGGQKQRVAIARALAVEPKVLLCDEATSALDPGTTSSILKLLKQINQELNITLVIITHQMEVIRQICDKVAILENGRLIEEGPVEQVFMKASSKAARRLFGSVPKEMMENLDVPALNLVFDGEHRQKPIIADIVKKYGIAINILSANMHRLSGKTYGQMLVERPAEQEAAYMLIEKLRAEGVKVEEVNVH